MWSYNNIIFWHTCSRSHAGRWSMCSNFGVFPPNVAPGFYDQSHNTNVWLEDQSLPPAEFSHTYPNACQFELIFPSCDSLCVFQATCAIPKILVFDSRLLMTLQCPPGSWSIFPIDYVMWVTDGALLQLGPTWKSPAYIISGKKDGTAASENIWLIDKEVKGTSVSTWSKGGSYYNCQGEFQQLTSTPQQKLKVESWETWQLGLLLSKIYCWILDSSDSDFTLFLYGIGCQVSWQADGQSRISQNQ